MSAMPEDLLNTYLTEDPNLLPGIRNMKAVCVHRWGTIPAQELSGESAREMKPLVHAHAVAPAAAVRICWWVRSYI